MNLAEKYLRRSAERMRYNFGAATFNLTREQINGGDILSFNEIRKELENINPGGGILYCRQTDSVLFDSPGNLASDRIHRNVHDIRYVVDILSPPRDWTGVQIMFNAGMMRVAFIGSVLRTHAVIWLASGMPI